MKPGKVRAIALCVFEHEGKLLVQTGYNRVTQIHFGRPLGGTIEFGEHSRATIIREMSEELGAEVTNLRYLGMLENIFLYHDTREAEVVPAMGHEIVILYRGELVDPSFYERAEIICDENGEPLTAKWISLADFAVGKMPLYPTGLVELLQAPG